MTPTHGDALQIPSNVRAVLAARIDRLGERDKQVLQAAAVIGKDFAAPVLRRTVAVLDSTSLTEAELDAVCGRLTDGEFLYAQTLYPVAEYAFKHPLTHEVALGSQLQERRRRTHAAVANALEEVHADHLDESAALIAHHHEVAGETLVAARWHRRAAQWAGLKDIMAALHHWHRVRELARLGDDKAESAALTIAACSEALIHGWRAGASATTWAALFEEGCAAAEGVGDLRALAMLNAAYSAVRALNQGIAPDYVRYSKTAVEIAERTGNTSLRCATRSFLMFGYVYCGELRDAERVADEIIQIAGDDPHLGTDGVGFSSLLAARALRNWCIGFSRDPSACSQEFARVRQLALESGYPEQALWAMCREAELKWALGSSDGARELAQAAARLVENLGVGNQIQAALIPCFALAGEGEWQASLDLATDTLRMIRERGALRLFEPSFLALIGLAELELGHLDAGRAAAAEGVAFMRESKCALHPNAYAVLARAQLALHEPASDIADTLDEYTALLERTEFHLFEGELYELRARLAEREGHVADRIAALRRAHDCYTRFGMTAQAARIAAAIG